MSNQPVKDAATYTTHSKHKTQIFMPSAGSEPDIPAIEQLQTYTLDATVTGIDILDNSCV